MRWTARAGTRSVIGLPVSVLGSQWILFVAETALNVTIIPGGGNWILIVLRCNMCCNTHLQKDPFW